MKKLAKIEEALQQFFTTNGRLPFPARPSDYNGTAYYLKEYRIGNAAKYSKANYKSTSSANVAQSTSTQYCNSASCTAYAGSIANPASQMIWGVVPTRTLGLPDDYAYDNQGKNFEYITDLQLATNNGMTFANSYTKANYTTNQSGKYDVLYTTTNASYTEFSMSLFPITIVNANTAKAIDATTNNVAYVLLSKQKQSCYWNNRAKNATITNSTKPSGNLLYNCQANYTNGNFATASFYQGYSKTFDNVLKYKTLPELVYTSAAELESKNEITQKKIVSYQPRDDAKLNTDSKNIISAINELKSNYDNLLANYNTLKADHDALLARVNKVQSTNDTSNKLFLTGATSQEEQPTTRSNSNVYMQNGTLYLTRATDLSGTANNKPALIVGGTDSQGHIEIDPNEIQAKSNATTTTELAINNDGGNVTMAPKGDVYLNTSSGDTYVGKNNTTSSLHVGKTGGSSKIYLNGKEFTPGTTLTQAQICEMMYPVGSVYMSTQEYKDLSEITTILGCGTWERQNFLYVTTAYCNEGSGYYVSARKDSSYITPNKVLTEPNYCVIVFSSGTLLTIGTSTPLSAFWFPRGWSSTRNDYYYEYDSTRQTYYMRLRETSMDNLVYGYNLLFGYYSDLYSNGEHYSNGYKFFNNTKYVGVVTPNRLKGTADDPLFYQCNTPEEVDSFYKNNSSISYIPSHYYPMKYFSAYDMEDFAKNNLYSYVLAGEAGLYFSTDSKIYAYVRKS